MTRLESISPAEAIGPVTAVNARRIGVIGDDHNRREDGSDLPAEALAAFSGVDLILHLGHMGVRERLARGVLDRLGSLAPVLAVRDAFEDTEDSGRWFVTPADGERVAGLTRVIDVNGTKIGAVHWLNVPPIPTDRGGIPELDGVDVPAMLRDKFGSDVDVVAFGGTHRAVITFKQGVLFVNPGSPTYPKGPWRMIKPGTEGTGHAELGTVGVLELSNGAVTFEIVELSGLSTVEPAVER